MLTTVLKSISAVTLIVVFSSSMGCSVYKAMSQPGPADLAGIGVGTPRQELFGRLGAPKFSDTTADGKKEDVFEFVSGAHQATKVRGVFYLAADVFTLALAELILWPIELTVAEAALCNGTASYDEKQKVQSWFVTSRNKSGQGC